MIGRKTVEAIIVVTQSVIDCVKINSSEITLYILIGIIYPIYNLVIRYVDITTDWMFFFVFLK